MEPTVSAFIVNYNTRMLLERCLQSIFSAGEGPEVEVFVADNNSSDGSVNMVEKRFPQVYLIRYPHNVGYTRAINPILPMATGKYCLLIHPDTELLPDTLCRLVDFLESNPQAGIVGGNLFYPDGTPNPCEVLWPGFKNDLVSFGVKAVSRLPGGQRLLGAHNPVEWSHKKTEQVPAVWNACMMVRRGVLEKLGYLDEGFFYGSSDWDLCKRAADAGWLSYYLETAKMIHHERQSFVSPDGIQDEIKYKVDGWYTAPKRYQDRYVFLRKHCDSAELLGVTAIYAIENFLRLGLILVSSLLGKVPSSTRTFHVKACLRTIQTILTA